jgi:hypothetical protein
MNTRKNPERLRGLVYRKVLQMVRDTGIHWICRLYSAAIADRTSWLQQTEYVEAECVVVRQRLASISVPMLSDQILRYAVEVFAKIIATYDNDIRRTVITRLRDTQIHHDICKHVLQTVLLPCISRCNVGTTESTFVQKILVNLLYVIPNIKVLILPSVELLDYMQLLVERLQILSHLQEFRFSVGCTTEVIVELSKYCPRLKKLLVRDSISVDDMCVERILTLRHIRSLDVSNTSVSVEGYGILIAGLPHLQNVIWPGPIDPVLMNFRPCLPSMRKFVGTVSAAGLLVRTCPNLRKLILSFLTDDISYLGQLKKVTILSIRNCSFTVIMLNTVFIRLGLKLLVLDLLEVENVNADDLINHCVVLKKLRISCCDIVSEVAEFSPALPHFRNLKELRLMQNRGPFDFCSLLHHYVNLKSFHAVSTRQINDTFIRGIVRDGVFRNLTEFIIDQCGEMDIETARLILNNCPSLSKLGNLTSWSGIVDAALITFLDFIREGNVSLTVCR